MTEDPFSTQGWNRYSYVGNSPVNFTDPSGYCFMGCFWKPVFKAIGQFFQQSWGTILQIGATMLCGGVPVCAAAVAMITSTFVAGVNGGSLAQALRAGLLSGLKAAAFYAVGSITSGFAGTLTEAGGHGPLAFGSPAHLVNMVGHAAVGCGFAVAEGGKCGPGAASGAAGSFAGPMLTGLKFEAQVIAHSVVGGLASVAGGGKFANGALTAAFGYLFNNAAECVVRRCPHGDLLGAGGGGGAVNLGIGAAAASIGAWFGTQINAVSDWLGGFTLNSDDNTQREYKEPKTGSGKQRASDVPSWAQGERPYKDESGKEFADRLLDGKYGEKKYDRGPGSEWSKIRKYGDRGFK